MQQPDPPPSPHAPDEIYRSIIQHLDNLRQLGTVDAPNHPAFARISALLTQGGESITAFIQQAGEVIQQYTQPISAPAEPVLESPVVEEPIAEILTDGQLYDLHNRLILTTPDKLFIPGMGTTAEYFDQYMAVVGPQGYIGLFNESTNFFEDFTQAMNDRLEASLGVRMDGAHNPSVETLKHHLQYAVDEGQAMEIIAHSQGGAILSAALNHLVRQGYTEEQLAPLNIITYGSAGTAFPRGPHYTHYVIMGDPVPFLALSADIFAFSIIGVGISYLLWRDNSMVKTIILPAGDDKDYIARTHHVETYFANIETPIMPSVNQSIEQLTAHLQQVSARFEHASLTVEPPEDEKSPPSVV